MKVTGVLSAAAAVVALAGLCTAQPTVDGSLSGDGYPGAADWLQNQPTQFGDNTTTPPCASDVSDAPNVTTGAEMVIPLSMLGPGPYLVSVVYISDDFNNVSNQISGGLPNQDEFPLGLARGLDLNTYAGNQYLTSTSTAAFVPVVDGVNDFAFVDDVQTTATSMGDNADATPVVSNGTELDNVTVRHDATNLYIFAAGNLDGNAGGRLAVFIDDGAGTGENQLTDVPAISFDRFQNMGESAPAAGDGMIFDAGFAPNHGFFIVSTGNALDMWMDYAAIDGTGLVGEYCGQGHPGVSSIVSTGLVSAGVEIYVDNSNVGGVTALCPPQTGNFDYAAGSEIDAIYSCWDATEHLLYITITGNLETNNNKLNLFFDVGDVVLVDANGNPAGTDAGQNALRPDNLPIDFGALTRMGDGDVDVGGVPVFTPGLIFDTGFNADYWIDFKSFDAFAPQSFANCSVLRTNGPLLNGNGFPFDYGAYEGGLMGGAPAATSFDGPTLVPQTGFDAEPLTHYAPRNNTRADYILMPPVAPTPGLIAYAIDNSNTAGVTDVDVLDAANVTTGIELRINTDELGWDGVSPVRLSGFLANSDNGFLSQQVIGGLPDVPPAANLGEPRGLDFSLIAGDQFITIPMVACSGGSLACSPFDLTTQGAGSGDPNYGVPDGSITAADIQYYVNAYVGGNLAIADLTTQGAGSGDPGYGVPDGTISAADIQYYVNGYVAGCP